MLTQPNKSVAARFLCLLLFVFLFNSGSDDSENGDDEYDKSKRKEDINRGFVFDDDDDDDDVDGVDGRSLPVVVDSEINEKDNSRDQIHDRRPHDDTDEERKEEDPQDTTSDDEIIQCSNYVVVIRKAYCVLSTHPQAAYPVLFQVRINVTHLYALSLSLISVHHTQ